MDELVVRDQLKYALQKVDEARDRLRMLTQTKARGKTLLIRPEGKPLLESTLYHLDSAREALEEAKRALER